MEITLRFGKKEDNESLRALFCELQTYEKSVYPGRTEPEGIAKEYMDDSIDAMLKGDYQIFIAECDGKVVGFAGAHPFTRLEEIVNTEHTYFIEDLVVSETYRRQGIGKQLLDFVAKYAREKGYKQFGLSVLAANKVTRDFYVRYGFEEYAVEYIIKIG